MTDDLDMLVGESVYQMLPDLNIDGMREDRIWGTAPEWWRERVTGYMDADHLYGDQEQIDLRRILRLPAVEAAVLRCAARIAELEAALAWQPIETAPHGVDVLLYCPDRGIANKARIELDAASSGVWSKSYHSWASHWMPLPAPPHPSTALAAASLNGSPSRVEPGNPAGTGEAPTEAET